MSWGPAEHGLAQIRHERPWRRHVIPPVDHGWLWWGVRNSPPDLASAYGFQVRHMRRHAGGYESEGWVADERWYVKVWRRATPPADLDLPVRLAAAGLPVPAPIRTLDGALYAVAGGRPLAVFPYVRGRTAIDTDWRLTAAALRRVHDTGGVDLPAPTWDEPEIDRLRTRLDHPWIRDRRAELVAAVDRLNRVTERARRRAVRTVLCHRDFGGFNLLIDDGAVVAVLDWEQAVLGPREYDVWAAAENAYGPQFLAAYGARDLDLDHLEYALLARGLRDLAARVLDETDRPGVETWGFRRIAKLDRDLAMFQPFCA